ncbi:light-harvesting protein, PufA [Thiorhodovibrio winogradskyi]|uniref:Light-harvesting protein, PufA n=1 Tax=Thiorhodovibrio winogradskyi TaxID=77007 RepID=A0ABZ0SE71_9GAMM|nr:light-harvesting antenna LH1, alpha subunit [Thiorhodovibrio winogradskyi]
MHKIWKIIDPRRAIITIFASQFLLGLLIHFILLGTDLNWLNDGIPPL